MGGCFIGPNHEYLHALAKETGVTTFKTYVKGENVLATGGKVRRYRGDIPKISPIALVSAGACDRPHELDGEEGLARRPVGLPPSAADWDALSVRAWMTAGRVPTKLARDLVEATVRACFTCDLSEVSMLSWLLLVSSAGGVESLMNISGGYQDSQFEGGVGQIPDALAHDLGDAVVLGAPVTAVTQQADRVEVVSDAATVTARRVVLALPRALAAGHPLRAGTARRPRAADPQDPRRHRGEDRGDLRRTVLARPRASPARR